MKNVISYSISSRYMCVIENSIILLPNKKKHNITSQILDDLAFSSNCKTANYAKG